VVLLLLGIQRGNRTPRTLNPNKPMVFIHRGMNYGFVENSTEAFQQTLEHGFNAVETDIRYTKDNKLVVFHDENCERLLGITDTLKSLNFSQLRNHNLLFNEKQTENKVLLLDDFLTHFKDSLTIYLDIKQKERWIADTLLVKLEKHNAYQTTLIASTDFWFVAYLKLKNRKVQTVLEGFNAGKGWLLFFIPARVKPDFYSGFLNKTTAKHLSFLKQINYLNRRMVYGVDSTNLNQVFELGIRHIIVDYHPQMGTQQTLMRRLKNQDPNQ
jgi:glycerophosphoryl diester phosphodiesterase